MTATPTPGDLSARHVEVLREVVRAAKAAQSRLNGLMSGKLADLSHDEFIALQSALTHADAAIAALSALPAAGGPRLQDGDVHTIACVLAREDGYDPADEHGGLYDLRWSGGPNPEPEGDAWQMDYMPKAERIVAALGGTTTPQPSAAEDYESWAKQERQREDTATRLGSAAVGAQGDGLRNVYLRDMEDTLRQLHSIVGMDNPDVDALIEKVRRLTAPDSSVERVVDDMRKMAADRWTPHGVRQDVIAWADRLATPAAGKEEISPEFTDSARAAIAWVLYHHQGGNSAIGQPLRFALGMGNHEPLPAWRIAEAKAWAEVCGETENFRREAALTRQPVAGDGLVLVSARQLQRVHSALSDSIGDTDPYVAPDATDDEVRTDEPVLWACQQISAMLAATPAATPTDGGEG